MSFLLLTLGVLAQSPAREPIPERVDHAWTAIEYPTLTGLWAHGRAMEVNLYPDAAEGGLQLYFSLGLEEGNAADDALFDALSREPHTRVRLHRRGAEAVEPTDRPRMIGGVSKMGWSRVYLVCRLPRGDDPLAEAWIEVGGDRGTAWLEVPYGFAAGAARIDPAARTEGVPLVHASACVGFRAEHQVVAWEAVRYELGRLADGSPVGLRQSNPTPASSDLTVERGDLFEPRTSVRVSFAGSEAKGRCVALRLHEGHHRRSDVHVLHASGKERGFGRLVASVGGEELAVWLPSSTFAFLGGHARATSR